MRVDVRSLLSTLIVGLAGCATPPGESPTSEPAPKATAISFLRIHFTLPAEWRGIKVDKRFSAGTGSGETLRLTAYKPPVWVVAKSGTARAVLDAYVAMIEYAHSEEADIMPLTKIMPFTPVQGACVQPSFAAVYRDSDGGYLATYVMTDRENVYEFDFRFAGSWQSATKRYSEIVASVRWRDGALGDDTVVESIEPAKFAELSAAQRQCR